MEAAIVMVYYRMSEDHSQNFTLRCVHIVVACNHPTVE